MASIKNIIGKFFVISLYYAFRVFPINNKKIFVSNFYGKGYGDSPKYITDYLLENYPGYDIVWSVRDSYEFPNGIRTVLNKGYMGLILTIYEQVTAKVWLDNCRKHDFERKRKSQYYIQTWHGDIGVKKCEGDAIDKIPIKEIKWSQHDSQMANLFVCGTNWMRTRIREAYWYDGEIAVCGLPRRDVLYRDNKTLIDMIKNKIGIPKDVKLLLYVPTFRDNDIFNGHLGGYVSYFEWDKVLGSMKKRFGGKWMGLIRLHPNAAKYKKDLSLSDNVVDVTDYPNIMDLLLIGDCCISDYSSALYDFAVTKKPGFIFAPDNNEYDEERGCYFPKEILPFETASNMQELMEVIENYDKKLYYARHDFFYKEIIQIQPEGHASEYLANRIINVCNNL